MLTCVGVLPSVFVGDGLGFGDGVGVGNMWGGTGSAQAVGSIINY